MATYIPASGYPVQMNPKQEEAFSLEELQAAVGGYIELCRIRTLDKTKQVMFVNEEGQEKKLPINPLATEMAGQIILGNVIVCSLKEAGEETTD